MKWHHLYLCCLFTLLVSSSFVSADLRTVALSGQQSPNAPKGAVYDGLFSPVLNDAGQVAFNGYMQSGAGGVTSDTMEAIWTEGSGALQLVARQGFQAAGTPSGAKFGGGFTVPSFNNNGQVAFGAALQSGAGGVTFTNNQGVWLGSSSLGLVARSGSQAPGTSSGVVFANFGSLAINDAGELAFDAGLQVGAGGVTPANDKGLWTTSGGTGLRLIERSGNQGLEFPPGWAYDFFYSPLLNNTGMTLFTAESTQGIGTGSIIKGLWLEELVANQIIVRTGAQVVGAPAGVRYSTVLSIAMNNQGAIVYAASLRKDSTSIPYSVRAGIWLYKNGTLSNYVEQGDFVPDGDLGNRIGGMEAVVLNSSGSIAFFSLGSTYGVFSNGLGNMTLVAKRGQQAPGVAPGGVFQLWQGISINDVGQTAFYGSLELGGSVNSSNNVGIWAQERDGTLRLIARMGDQLEVAPGDFREIANLSFNGGSGNGDGRLSGFNNRGQLAFWASFTDGSEGVFVSDLVAIPEPSSFAILAIACVGFAPRCRR